MGCVSSTMEDEFRHIGGNGVGHHIVYGFLNLDPPSSDRCSPTIPPTLHPRFTLAPLLPQPPGDISFPFSPQSSKPFPFRDYSDKENSTPNKPLFLPNPPPSLLDGFEILCPPKGHDRVVVYTTSLRGVRKTFESCNAVRAAIEGLGVLVCERDISMDKGFKDELTELMTGKGNLQLVPPLPSVFVKGRYIGGVEEVMKILEEGNLGKLLQGLPRLKAGYVCEGCGGARFLPCFRCNGSCKLVMAVKEEVEQEQCRKTVVVQCSDCNENGLMLCPICS